MYSCKETKTTEFLYSDQLLKEGDIVFRCGRSMVSNAVLVADKGSSYSHIGIVVKDGRVFKIVHAVPEEHDSENDVDRVKIDDIQTFFDPDRAISGAVMRIADSIVAKQAAGRALHIFERGTLFDHSYNLNDSSKMYCTELVYFVYNQSGIDLTEGRRNEVNLPALDGTYIFPSDIQRNSNLQLLYSY